MSVEDWRLKVSDDQVLPVVTAHAPECLLRHYGKMQLTVRRILLAQDVPAPSMAWGYPPTYSQCRGTARTNSTILTGIEVKTYFRGGGIIVGNLRFFYIYRLPVQSLPCYFTFL